MTPRFSVRTVPAFERLARRLAAQHPEFTRLWSEAIEILQADPHNAGRWHGILKLKGVPAGEGQYRSRPAAARPALREDGRPSRSPRC